MKDDTALLLQALKALENELSAWHSPPETTTEAIDALRKRLRMCPECNGETETVRTWVTNVETFYDACTECDWRGEPE
jgi:hypothetical protein